MKLREINSVQEEQTRGISCFSRHVLGGVVYGEDIRVILDNQWRPGLHGIIHYSHYISSLETL